MKTAAGNYSDRVDGRGMTLVEIAAELGVTRSAVWFILQRAYRKLRRNPRAIAALRACAQLEASKRNRQLTWIDQEAEGE